MRAFDPEMATMVGFLRFGCCQIFSRRPDESSLSQSITMRSVVPRSSSLIALEELRQTLVAIDRLRRIGSTIRNNPGSRVTNKHSNAMSEVINLFFLDD